MYIIKTGIINDIPDDPEVRCDYYLKQIEIYLSLNRDSREYEQIDIIFKTFINVKSDISLKLLIEIYKDTGNKLQNLYAKSGHYWMELTKYVNWKITGRID